MTLSGWIFLGMTYVFLWQYQAEFFWEWRKYFYDNIKLNFPANDLRFFYDNIRLNFSGNDVSIFMTISGWIFLGMTYVFLWQYQAEFSWEWEIFQTKDAGKTKTHISWSITWATYKIITEGTVRCYKCGFQCNSSSVV